MNKKTILVLAIAALVAFPMAAMGATVSAPATPATFEFTLGGYVKMETAWDSTQSNILMTSPVMRNNDPTFQHGRLKMTANNSRFNFTIKGPKVFGAQVTGFLEFDCGGQSGLYGGIDTASVFRMRHAFFRLNWPETELLMGQYWGMLSEFPVEAAQDGGLQHTGWPNQRAAQVRLTQKFLGTYTLSAALVAPTNMYDSANQAFVFGNAPGTAAAFQGNTTLPGETSETPQVQVKAAYEADLYGKAAFWGAPRGFTAQVAAAWQRTRYRPYQIAAASHGTWGQDGFGTVGTANILTMSGMVVNNQQYLEPWIVQATLFVPVITTTTANLAGTASLSTSWYIGQGTDFIGEGLASQGSWLQFNGRGFANNSNVLVYDLYTRKLTQRYGGYLQGQYYFTNQWFVNVVYGFNKALGVSQARYNYLASATNAGGYGIALPADMYKFWEQINLTLWYRPIQALKFGVQYSYERTDWFQKVSAGMAQPGVPAATPAGTVLTSPGGSKITDQGENHRVMFAGFFYF